MENSISGARSAPYFLRFWKVWGSKIRKTPLIYKNSLFKTPYLKILGTSVFAAGAGDKKKSHNTPYLKTPLI